jgi:hypothetical protein
MTKKISVGALLTSRRPYNTSMNEYVDNLDRVREMPIGALVRFVHAPPRWPGEKPRDPGSHLLGTVGVILSDGMPCGHGWGGLFSVYSNEHNEYISYYGDFLEVIK